MKSYKIYFIRHGITGSNLSGQYIGITDVNLSEDGIRDIENLSKKYSYPGTGVVYTSPLNRCVQTCRLLYPDISPIIIDGLKECNFGIWEGKRAEELLNNPEYISWLENAQHAPPQGGESGIEFTKRVCNTFEKLVEGLMKTGTTSAVVVTHGGIIMTLLSTYGIPKAKPYDWITKSGCGYSVRITPGLWMRGKVFEVYEKIPNPFCEK